MAHFNLWAELVTDLFFLKKELTYRKVPTAVGTKFSMRRHARGARERVCQRTWQ
eukprot:SAG31_NODE_28952_length_403_cov_0.671053_1_plen_53_part_10